MRSQLKLVITTWVVCHLVLGAAPVISQALPVPAQDGAGAQEARDQSATPCHAILTAPPSLPGPSGAKPANHATTPKIAVSQEEPVDITARECEKAGDIYTLR